MIQDKTIQEKGLKKPYKNLFNSTWTGMVPVDDTALAVTDTGGPGIPVIYSMASSQIRGTGSGL